MTVFATSWRRAEPALLALALLLGACGAPKKAEEPVPPPAPPAAKDSAPPPTPTPAASSAGAGLRPLPTAGQVVSSLPRGRSNPFGEVLPRPRPPAPSGSAGGSSGPGGSAAPGPDIFALPPDFRLAGVMRSGGRSAAVVQAGERSGSVRPGDRGGRSTDLLPPGWTVASIDVNRGRMTLQRGGRRVSLDL